MAQLYLWAKAAHVVAVLLFSSGALLASFACSSLPQDGDGAAVAARLRRLDRLVTTPAMISTWALGLVLATSGGWLWQPWLVIKLVLVVVVSAMHGVVSARLRRLAEGEALGSFAAAPIIAGCFVVIATLAVVKPGH